MHIDLTKIKEPKSSFWSCEKDIETILKRLFIENIDGFSDTLKRLLVVNTKDCLTNLNEPKYKLKLADMKLPKLLKEGYIKVTPKVRIPEFEEVKTYLIITFDNFMPTMNPKFRDCMVHFDIMCHTDYWQMDNYQTRPLKIAGIIDGLMNESKLSGIGTFQFVGCNEVTFDETFSGYCLITFEPFPNN